MLHREILELSIFNGAYLLSPCGNGALPSKLKITLITYHHTFTYLDFNHIVLSKFYSCCQSDERNTTAQDIGKRGWLWLQTAPSNYLCLRVEHSCGHFIKSFLPKLLMTHSCRAASIYIVVRMRDVFMPAKDFYCDMQIFFEGAAFSCDNSLTLLIFDTCATKSHV